VHTGNGGLVIEVSDIGIGMTESDLRVANTRLQSGGEVNPYTARHMGLFVVGRLAAQHGLVVRLRSTIAGEPNSGTTAGVYVPSELLTRGVADQYSGPEYGTPADAHSGILTALALDEEHHDNRDHADESMGQHYTNGHGDVPISVLPQRNPGASGIADVPSSLAAPEEPEPERPTNTSAFFASRAQAAANGASSPPPAPEPPTPVEQPQPEPAVDADDAIYQKMLSEWLVDPTELANSEDLNWESVWDHGWSAAAAADEAPVREHTEEGLPVREPGARLVPGAADRQGPASGGQHRNGGAHRNDTSDDAVASAAEFDAGPHAMPPRDPDAVRASISNHFGGVHAGRSDARDIRGTQ
jgi:hypothetical protein